jgi:hypothetical protein
MCHSEGLNFIETSLACASKRWRDLTSDNRKEDLKQIPITDFLKKYFFADFHHVKNYFRLRDLSFEAIMYFSHDLIIS